MHMGVKWHAAQSARCAPRRMRGDVRGNKCCSLELTLGRGRGSRAVALAVTHCPLWAANGDNAQSIQSAVLRHWTEFPSAVGDNSCTARWEK